MLLAWRAKGEFFHMKKFLTLMFSFLLVASLATPVFASKHKTSNDSTMASEEKKEEKSTKKKSKKSKKEKKEAAAPATEEKKK